MSILASFRKSEACGQTVLPDRSVLIGQKLVENAKIQKFKCDILSNFETFFLPYQTSRVLPVGTDNFEYYKHIHMGNYNIYVHQQCYDWSKSCPKHHQHIHSHWYIGKTSTFPNLMSHFALNTDMTCMASSFQSFGLTQWPRRPLQPVL